MAIIYIVFVILSFLSSQLPAAPAPFQDQAHEDQYIVSVESIDSQIREAVESIELEYYKVVIAFAEPRMEEVFLPYSYPLAYWDSIKLAADNEGLDAYIIAALIREESRFDRKITSWAGAIGLMQLMPSTAKRMGKTASESYGGRYELQDSRKNILLGSHYLAGLIKEYKKLPLAIAAYNAGENALEKWLNKFDNNDIIEFIENIPYSETRNYVKKVMKSYWQYKRIYRGPASVP